MKTLAAALRLAVKRRLPSMPDRVAQAVRNSLNLPKLKVEARRGPGRGSWQVRMKQGRECSAWLTLHAGAVEVIRKVALLPPMLHGQFRVAYDAIRTVR